MLNYLIGKGSSHFELGAGIMPTYVSGTGGSFFYSESSGETESSWMLAGTATIGYRYQPREKGLIFRIGITPGFTTTDFIFSFGISVGATF
ncbi:MAG: hypothetical protein Q8868_01545 [Bacteroidota bacterium]|nr:hypothetical protein [Bacteroidota bacterium]